MIEVFDFSRTPRVVFGPGRIGELPQMIRAHGYRSLLVTGSGSHGRSSAWERTLSELDRLGIEWFHARVSGEPGPGQVDAVAAEHRARGVDSVTAWGGGSAIDAGKAVAAMLTVDRPVEDFIEGVGRAAHPGTKVPFIAVPTTAGAGTEATYNAVLSRVGPDGYKRSLRHPNFMPDAALIDPELAATCPPETTAACGMDALSQLIESFASTRASAMTDALAAVGLEAAGRSLLKAWAGDPRARSDMALAAHMSGLALANAGLGVVHGLAGPMGGLFPIPHGAACGAILAPAVAATVDKLEADRDRAGLEKLGRIGGMLSGRRPHNPAAGCELLVRTLERWTLELGLPKLGEFGISASDLDAVAAAGSNKNNPARLEPAEMKRVLEAAL